MAKSLQQYGQPANYNVSPNSRADGAASALEVNSVGSLIVQLQTGTSVGASTTDISTFTTGTTAGAIEMGVYQSSPDTIASGNAAAIGIDANRNVKVTLATLIAGEDLSVTGGVLRTEAHYIYKQMTTSTQVLSAAGFVHSVTVAPLTSTPTPGVIAVYDSLTPTGTLIHEEWVPFAGTAHTVLLDSVCATGLYVYYVGSTASVSVTASYRTQP